MDVPSPDTRAEWAARVGDENLHRRLLDELPCLHRVAQCRAGPPSELTGWLRVVAWNVQRGRRPAELADLLHASGAGVCLLSELDDGMARTQNEKSPTPSPTPSPPTPPPTPGPATRSVSSSLSSAWATKRSSGPLRGSATTAACTATPSCRRPTSATRSSCDCHSRVRVGSPSTHPNRGGRPCRRARHRRPGGRSGRGGLDPPREPHRRWAPGRTDGVAPTRTRRAERRRPRHCGGRLQHAGCLLRRSARPAPDTES